jgi:hypothetical protein
MAVAVRGPVVLACVWGERRGRGWQKSGRLRRAGGRRRSCKVSVGDTWTEMVDFEIYMLDFSGWLWRLVSIARQINFLRGLMLGSVSVFNFLGTTFAMFCIVQY